MSQFDLIKDLAKYGLENNQEHLLVALNQLVEHSKKTKKINFALQLQSIIRDSIQQTKTSGLTRVGSDAYFQRLDDRETGDLILDKITSDYTFDNLIAGDHVCEELRLFVNEHRSADMLRAYGLPISNKVLLHGPSGCGKTLASYVLAGELNKMLIVVNLGAIVSSKLGETSKNLAKVFHKAASENCAILLDEFDSLGKVRDYDQDHGEMKRVVNTILQLFDYLPQSTIVIAATNQVEMLDEALLRRFDVNLNFELPNQTQIQDLINMTLKQDIVTLPKASLSQIIKSAVGLSYFSVQKTLITAIKRSLFEHMAAGRDTKPTINMTIWKKLIEIEKNSLGIH